MPTYVVARSGYLVLENWLGRVSLAELLQHLQQQLTDTSIVSGADSLVDCRGASFPEVNPESIHEILALFAKHKSELRVRRYAIVLGGRDFTLARIFERRMARYGVKVIVFSEFRTACSWLGVEPADALQWMKALDE